MKSIKNDPLSFSKPLISFSLSLFVQQLSLKCENNDLFISPLVREIHSTFHLFLDRFAHAARNLPSLQSFSNPFAKDDNSSVIPDWYMEECHKKMDIVLEEILRPVVSYVETVREKYKMVFDVQAQQKQVSIVAQSHDFEGCLRKLDEFDHSVEEVAAMVSKTRSQ